jgi:TRAP-type C4-dicarboxylate transport system permease small subunit
MKVYTRIVNLCAALAALLIPLIMVGVSIDVGGRYLFGQPLGWVFEMTEYALLCIPFLGMAWLVRQGGHVTIDLAVEAAPERRRPMMRAFAAVVAAGVCAVGSFWGFLAAWDNFERGVTTVGIYPVQKFPFLAIIAIGFLLSTIAFVINAREEMTGNRQAPPGDAPATSKD